jgi:hypothetical protein
VPAAVRTSPVCASRFSDAATPSEPNASKDPGALFRVREWPVVENSSRRHLAGYDLRILEMRMVGGVA